eukprot:9325671-Alexandrium_andersonii.AAC.1
MAFSVWAWGQLASVSGSGDRVVVPTRSPERKSGHSRSPGLYSSSFCGTVRDCPESGNDSD